METFRLWKTDWKSERIDKLDDMVALETVGLTIAMKDIYRLVFP